MQDTRDLMIILVLVAIITFAMVMVLASEPRLGVSYAQTAGANNQNENQTITQSIMPASSNKTFYVFSESIEGLENGHEEMMHAAGPHPYKFSPPVIVANQGDNVTVHFYSADENATQRHSFTIDAQPYRVNIDIGAGENGSTTFTAQQEGIFPFYCIYHLPNMIGQLVVLPGITSEAAETTTMQSDNNNNTTQRQAIQ